MFWTFPLSIIRSFSLYTAMVYVIQLASRIRTEPVPSWSCSQAVSKPVWHIPLLCVQWKTPDDGQRNCLKYVEFYSKNKFEKLVHLVGFIISIYHDAWSPERHIVRILPHKVFKHQSTVIWKELHHVTSYDICPCSWYLELCFHILDWIRHVPSYSQDVEHPCEDVCHQQIVHQKFFQDRLEICNSLHV